MLLRHGYLIWAVAIVLIFVKLAHGQGETTSAIVGSVVDQSSAAISGAIVTVTNVENGLKRSVKTDDAGRLLVLGGHGCSGTFLEGFGQPRIDDYSNNDGWFDDTSDGPVTARLIMQSSEVDRTRYIDVEYPAWVIAAYPAYVPQVLDIVTLDDAVYDTAVTKFAARTDIYGKAGTFAFTPTA